MVYNLTKVYNRNNRKIWKIYIPKAFFLGFSGVLSLTIANNSYASENHRRFFIRQEIVRENGVLISRPNKSDEAIAHMLETNKIKSLEDYSHWLKENIRYHPDPLGDRWASSGETLRKKQGDCEDFAFLTADVLRGLGYQPRFFALVKEGKAHAICAFKKDGYYMWFDNTTLKHTRARTLKEFARSVTEEYHFMQLSELDTETHGWRTIYRKS